MRFYKIALCALLLLIPASSLRAQAMREHQAIESARLFVQGFYDWYVPLAHKENKERPSDVAIRIKPDFFDKKLITALREDSSAQDKEPGDIAGLDFDPFLNSQDPSDHYDAGKINRKGASYFVEIYGTRDGVRSDKPDVIAEVVRKNKSWVFINFHQTDGYDLLSTLSRLKLDRNKRGK